jgi:hypothetical protein
MRFDEPFCCPVPVLRNDPPIVEFSKTGRESRERVPKAFRHHPTAPFEARHPRHRNRFPNTVSLRCCLPRGSLHPPHRGRADALCTVSHGAAIAPPTPSRNLQRLPQTPDPSDETDAAHNCAFDCYPRTAPFALCRLMNKVG